MKHRISRQARSLEGLDTTGRMDDGHDDGAHQGVHRLLEVPDHGGLREFDSVLDARDRPARDRITRATRRETPKSLQVVAVW